MEIYVMKNTDLSDISMQNLTETEKEHLILKCKDASSKEEAEEIVNSYKSSEDKGYIPVKDVVYGMMENPNNNFR
jgi:hypothetical protein